MSSNEIAQNATRTAVTSIIWEAFNNGLLNENALTVYGLNVSLEIKASHNRLTIERDSVARSLVLWGEDSDNLTIASISNVVAFFLP